MNENRKPTSAGAEQIAMNRRLFPVYMIFTQALMQCICLTLHHKILQNLQFFHIFIEWYFSRSSLWRKCTNEERYRIKHQTSDNHLSIHRTIYSCTLVYIYKHLFLHNHSKFFFYCKLNYHCDAYSER